MALKHNRRTKLFRRYVTFVGWRPLPTYTLPAKMPRLSVGTLVYDTPSAIEECAYCGMDATMQADLELCPVCHCCVHWEIQGMAGSCCTCGALAVSS